MNRQPQAENDPTLTRIILLLTFILFLQPLFFILSTEVTATITNQESFTTKVQKGGDGLKGGHWEEVDRVRIYYEAKSGDNRISGAITRANKYSSNRELTVRYLSFLPFVRQVEPSLFWGIFLTSILSLPLITILSYINFSSFRVWVSNIQKSGSRSSSGNSGGSQSNRTKSSDYWKSVQQGGNKKSSRKRASSQKRRGYKKKQLLRFLHQS